MRRTRLVGRSIAAGGCVVLALTLSQTAQAQATLVVNTTADTVDVAPGDGRCADASGRCSLRAAIQEANASSDETIIVLGGATYTLTIAGAGEDGAATGDLDVTSSIVLEGRGSTVNANGIDRAFHVLANGNLRVEDLTVTGGRVGGGSNPIDGSGAGFSNRGTLTIVRSNVSGNVANGPLASGGGILNTGTLVVDRSSVSNNSATRAGGGIEANGGSTTVGRSSLNNNATGPTPGNGGGLHLTGTGTVLFDRSTASGNTASAEGGGLWNSATGTMTVDRSTIVGNTASGNAAVADGVQGGGALFQEGPGSGTLTVSRSEVRNNVANGPMNGSGGGILNDRANVFVSRSVVAGNSAVRAGGGIEASSGFTRVDDSTLERNTTGPNPGNGGGLHLTGPGRVEIDDSIVTRNSATNEGGGLWNSSTGTMIVTDTSVSGNTAPVGPNVFNQPPGGVFTLNGQPVPPGPNNL